MSKFGGPSDFKPRDLLESSVIDKPHNNSQRVRNRVFKHFIIHRDLLGYPKGCTNFPYFVCTNDLCSLVLEFIALVSNTALNNGENKEKLKDILFDMPNLLKLLIRSYDDVNCDHGCCAPWHSMSKEQIISFRDTLKSSLELHELKKE